MKQVLAVLLLCSTTVLIAQVPYERWFQGIIYGSNGRAYADSTAILTGQFYPSSTFLVKTDALGQPISTRMPSMPNHFNQLQASGFSSTGEPVLFNSNAFTGVQKRSAVLSKWTTELDTVWAYAYRDTSFDTAAPNGSLFQLSEDGYLLGLNLTDTVVFASASALAFLDTDGAVQWAKDYPSSLILSNVVRANDGGFLCTGADGAHHLCFKTDAQFNVQWCQEFSAPFEQRYEKVVQGVDDVIHYFTGIRDTGEVINFSTRTYSRSMAWLDLDPANGSLLNTREVDFRWPTIPTHLMRTSDGNFLAAGTYTNTSLLFGVLRRWEAYVLKLNAAGDMIWADSLAMPNYRNRVVSMDEHEERLLLYTERYDDINPFHQYFLLDTAATPICDLERTDFHPLGTLPITAAPYTLPAFTNTALARASITWTIGNSAVTSLHLCGGPSTSVEEFSAEPPLLYPDPVADQMHLRFLDQGKGTLTITDLDGRIIYRLPDQPMIDVHGLAPGVYILVRQVGEEKRIARFVKE